MRLLMQQISKIPKCLSARYSEDVSGVKQDFR